MSRQKSSVETPSPLLRTLQQQIMPSVRESGMNNIIVARSTLREMQMMEDDLPAGASIAHKPLLSKRVPIRKKRNCGIERATIDAHWPEDGLESKRVPILMFVATGRVTIPLGDYVLRCTPGQGALILPGTPHPDGSQLCLDDFDRETGVCSMLSFRVIADGVMGWLSHTREGKHWSDRGIIVGESCHIMHPQARAYLETLTEEAKTRPPHFRSMCDSLLRLFMTLLLREIQESRAYQPAPLRHVMFDLDAPPMLQERDPIARIEDYVRNHMQENLSIDRVAAYVYMSRAHFTRQFRAATGKTFNEYVTECRLEAAKVLLENTELPVNNISELVGVTPARLRVLFRQHEELSPGEFRWKVREGRM